MRFFKETISTANRAITAVQSVADAVIALPEAIHEASELLVEQRSKSNNLARINGFRARIAELEIENRKLLDANHGLKTESDKLRWEGEKRGERIKELGSELATLRAKDEPSIPEPDPGEGFETCSRDDATEVNWKIDGCRWDEHWYSVSAPFAWDNEEIRVYRFRRPIAKWLACTAEEAKANPSESEWMTSGDKWATMRVSPSNDFNRAFRSRAKLPEFAVVTRSIWDSEALASCERYRQVGLNDGDTWTYRIKRSDVPVGTVLG